jgi:hypothetical protein
MWKKNNSERKVFIPLMDFYSVRLLEDRHGRVTRLDDIFFTLVSFFYYICNPNLLGTFSTLHKVMQ